MATQADQISQHSNGFTTIDWIVLGLYFLTLAITGYLFSRKKNQNTEDYFLGNRQMPPWAVAISIVATSLSAVTFISVPESAYTGNITYLATNIGMIIAALVIAFVFLPAFYHAKSASIYELLETRFGTASRKAASITFLIGRVLASGARIYAGAIPASILIFGLDKGTDPQNLVIAISLLTFVGIVYTLAGGISSVIWSDVIQFGILIGAALVAIVLISSSFTVPFSQIITELQTGAGDNQSKLVLFDLSLDPRHPFSLPAVIIGFTLLGIGSYGTDQDLAQRMLTCSSAKGGARSIITGILLAIPTVSIFLIVGLLLWVVYQRPEMTSLTGDAPSGDSVKVFIHYIMTQIPPGVRGLMMAGLFAAGLSSLNSAINAMGAAFISDLYRPMVTSRNIVKSEEHYVYVGRISVVCWGIILGVFACICIHWKSSNNETLINFALGVMGIAYAGLIGVFFTALFTKRGSNKSVITALVFGFVWMIVTQGFVYNQLEFLHNSSIEYFYSIHFTWKLTLGVIMTTTISMLGNRPSHSSKSIAAPDAA
ncbi:MAG: sodium:solute symporter [Phycisphaerales bacterium]|nr:sodium:solute symporter [Phycisphaerales bacterium]